MGEAADPFLGKKVHGYRLESLLGRGAVTAVYRAHALEPGQIPELIITLLLVPETLPGPLRQRFLERFLQEAGQIEKIHHQNICPLYGYGEQDGYCYLLSPALEGETLLALMRHHKRWTPQEILYLLSPIANAFEYLHRQGRAWQFFHPANVIILKDTTLSIEPVQLTGLGLLSMLRRQGLEEVKVDIGTCEHLKSIADTYSGAPEYLAPEIVKGAEGDGRSDMYALGILLFSLLSGSPPFDGESYLEIVQKHVYEPLPSLYERAPDLPAAMELVINRALQRHPDFRYQRPGELIAAYMHIVNERLQQPERLDISRRLMGLPPLPTPVFAERFRLTAAATPNIVTASSETSKSYVSVPGRDEAEQETDDEDVWETVRLPALPRAKKATQAAGEHPAQERRPENSPPSVDESVPCAALSVDDLSRESAIIRSGMQTDIASMSSQLQQLKERLQAQTKRAEVLPPQVTKPEASSSDEEAFSSVATPAAEPEGAGKTEKSEGDDPYPVWLN